MQKWHKIFLFLVQIRNKRIFNEYGKLKFKTFLFVLIFWFFGQFTSYAEKRSLFSLHTGKRITRMQHTDAAHVASITKIKRLFLEYNLFTHFRNVYSINLFFLMFLYMKFALRHKKFDIIEEITISNHKSNQIKPYGNETLNINMMLYSSVIPHFDVLLFFQR